MRKLFIFILITLIIGCASLKAKKNIILKDSVFAGIENIEVREKSTIKFITDSTFIYTLGDLHEGRGKWKISPNGKYILLTGNLFFKFPREDVFIESLNATLKTGYQLTWMQSLNIKLRIENEDTLINKYGYVYIKEK
jgi:hypothetical protein